MGGRVCFALRVCWGGWTWGKKTVLLTVSFFGCFCPVLFTPVFMLTRMSVAVSIFLEKTHWEIIFSETATKLSGNEFIQ